VSCCESAPVTHPLSSRHRLRVRYYGGRPIEVTGPVTGTRFRFSGKQPLHLVDPRDAVQFSRNRLFRLEGLVEVPETESD